MNAVAATESGLKRAVWVAYGLNAGAMALSLIPAGGTVSFVIWIAAFIIVLVKRSEAAGTIFESHCSNLLSVSIISIVAEFVILISAVAMIAVVGLFAPILAMIAQLILFVWQLYRIVKGMLRINDAREYA
ncbi:hypothetical protein [Rhodopseudomonas palustris]|uniref:hypothetical protein n=1 Tax=Rhodopseudomonas palustris TaxID=1076 RepID=UPI0021F28218|nr:hypothetical protein [Rhodopseudomonas palustris]UYO54589.1 hypothetical protein KQX61_03975 [Rhodopseudomonas palustris]